MGQGAWGKGDKANSSSKGYSVTHVKLYKKLFVWNALETLPLWASFKPRKICKQWS